MARSGNPFSFTFTFAGCDQETLWSLEPFLASLRLDTLSFMELGGSYPTQALNRILLALCDDLKHLTLLWKRTHFNGKLDQICESDHFATGPYYLTDPNSP